MCAGAAEGPDLQRDGARGQEEASGRYRHSQVLAESYFLRISNRMCTLEIS